MSSGCSPWTARRWGAPAGFASRRRMGWVCCEALGPSSFPAGTWTKLRPRRCSADCGRRTWAGARLVSICSGVFVLAATGLLDGKRATTHWRYAERLAARYPRIRVDADRLYVDEGSILTSAGSAAGIDLCLHIVRRDHGAEVANSVARRLVMPPHRDGGQAQFVAV